MLELVALHTSRVMMARSINSLCKGLQHLSIFQQWGPASILSNYPLTPPRRSCARSSLRPSKRAWDRALTRALWLCKTNSARQIKAATELICEPKVRSYRTVLKAVAEQLLQESPRPCP